MNLLFYTSFNERSRDTESLIESFYKQGHTLFVLTQTEKGIYHEYCQKVGAKTYSHNIPKKSFIYFIKHAIFLIRFCKDNKIDIVYSHIENASLSAVLAQYFIKARVIACRHIIDEAYLLKSKKFILLNKLVYFLAKEIIVVSKRCKDHMVMIEGVSEKKIRIIYLAYNFNLYQQPNPKIVKEIKETYKANLLFITACRMIKPKRPEIAIEVVKKLIDDGIDAKLLLLGTGTYSTELESYIKKLNLSDRIFLLGFKSNIMDYLTACDALIHPSILDSSSVIIKEAGLCKKAVVTCSGIGDVDEYLINNINSILVSKENSATEMYIAIKNQSNNLSQTFGTNLHQSVINRFSIENILPLYNIINVA